MTWISSSAKSFKIAVETDFDAAEKAEVVTNCDHLHKLKFSKALPFAFTEYGAVALANILASSQAVEMGIYVVRPFVRLRQAASLHQDLANGAYDLDQPFVLVDDVPRWLEVQRRRPEPYLGDRHQPRRL